MGKLIAVEFGMKWGTSVEVCIRNGMWERISGPDAALVCMKNRWPPLRAERYIEARAACLGALCGITDPLAARDMFIAAGIEAGILGYPHLGGSHEQHRPIG